MSTERMLMNVNDVTTLGKLPLAKSTINIITAINNGAKNDKEIAKEVYTVDHADLACAAGFKGIGEWAEKFFDWHKTKTSRLSSIAKRFYFEDENKTIWEAYTVSQMVEMLKASDEQLNAITPDMTAKQIRDYLKRESEMIDAETETAPEDVTPDETDTEAETETEPETTTTTATYTEVKTTEDITEMLSTVKHYAQEGYNIMVNNGGGVFTVLIQTNVIS